MNSTKILSSLCLFGGFLAGAYVVVAQETQVNWIHYTICAGVMFVGLVASRLASRSDGEETARHDEDLDVLRTSLSRLQAAVRGYTQIEKDEDLLDLHTRIDAELVEEFANFVEARESMIPRFGIQVYTDIMSAFATGERLINRVWSASADGYVDEVRLSLGTALSELERAGAQLKEARD